MMHVLGMWVSVVDMTEEILDRVVARAWGAYHSIKDQLLQKLVHINDRTKLLESVVGGGLRYAWSVLSLTQAQRQPLSSLQTTIVTRLSTLPRAHFGAWLEWYIASRRHDSQLLLKCSMRKWGDRQLVGHLNFLGHASRLPECWAVQAEVSESS